VTVVDLRTRDRFMIAASDARMPDKIYKTAIRLALHFNCKTGRLDPGYQTVADEIGVSLRTLMRCIKALKEGGWLLPKRGGTHDVVSFTLCIPAARATTEDTSIDDIAVSPMNGDPYVTKTASIGDKNGIHTCHHAVTHNRGTERTEKSAPPARAPRLVVSAVPVIIDARAGAFRALCRAHPEDADPNTATEARKIFDQLIDEGLDPEKLIEAADNYCDKCRGINLVKPLSDWLRSRAFQLTPY
jgi:hypothetical protein